MIYTLTLNPSLDVICTIDDFRQGEVNIVSSKKVYPGGKGINVSLILKELDIPSLALGIIAGESGKRIKELVDQYGIQNDFIEANSGESRVNIKLLTDKKVTELNEKGPNISQEISRIYRKLDVLQKDDYLVISGSVHPDLDNNIYRYIIEYLEHQEINVVLDTKADLLIPCLALHPFLIKPNLEELAEIFSLNYQQVLLLDTAELEKYAFQLIDMGAQNVILSLGEKGAILVCEDGECIKMRGIEGVQVNPVGAGDSLVAGFIAGFIETGDKKYSLELGSACGAATAFSLWLGKKSQIEMILMTL